MTIDPLKNTERLPEVEDSAVCSCCGGQCSSYEAMHLLSDTVARLQTELAHVNSTLSTLSADNNENRPSNARGVFALAKGKVFREAGLELLEEYDQALGYFQHLGHEDPEQEFEKHISRYAKAHGAKWLEEVEPFGELEGN